MMIRGLFYPLCVCLVSLASVASIAACTADGSETPGVADSGANTPDGGSSTADSGGSGNDGGGGTADSSSNADVGAAKSKTKAGESCEKEDFPPAASACSIPGTYTVTDSFCSATGAGCQDINDPPFTWTADVSIDGNEVELTNGTNRLLHCDLTPPCTCISKSGREYRFTSTGFIAEASTSCSGSATQKILMKGVKQ